MMARTYGKLVVPLLVLVSTFSLARSARAQVTMTEIAPTAWVGNPICSGLNTSTSNLNSTVNTNGCQLTTEFWVYTVVNAWYESTMNGPWTDANNTAGVSAPTTTLAGNGISPVWTLTVQPVTGGY